VSRRANRRVAPQHARAVRFWTLSRATGIGLIAGLAALLVAGFAGAWMGDLLYVYAALLLVTALCGFSILWITLFDMRARGTSALVRPIRGFDFAIGFVLLLPAAWALSEIWGDLRL